MMIGFKINELSSDLIGFSFSRLDNNAWVSVFFFFIIDEKQTNKM